MPRLGPDDIARLAAAHGAALVLYARQWSTAPEDVVQDAFMQLVRTATTSEDIENPAAWLFRAVRNRAIDLARANDRRRKHESEAATAAGLGEPWFLPTSGAGLDIAAATAALAALPEHERETIVARLWGGLSFAEVGRLTGVSAATAYRTYIAGLSTLRERMGILCRTTN